ncbi:MAG: TRAP transporter small permease subunit [SAR324 cluster bacterium]|jgi:TRAP-type mannitol/chloroaromatic compound transport system permease small subunit|nr:TRAP transporter small permease subunit [SAR324 cluster bacterium]|tara:strand:- start:1913 stop:2515 length:603 start_codon:yes stop_codon:yes gene_type:complete
MDETLDRISDGLRRFVDTVGKLSTFFIIPLVFITMWDVICRKLVWIQIWLVANFGRIFESTLLQELEWHFHTALFLMVLGYGFTHNRHVRVDFIRENLTYRKKVWIDFLGTSLFMIPWVCVLLYFSFIYTRESFIINEVSASLVGLSHRWIIKSFLIAGFVCALLSGIAVWLQTVILLFGRSDYRFEPMTLDMPPESIEN